MLDVLQAVVFMMIIGVGLIPSLDDRMDAPSLSTFLQKVALIDAEVAPDLRQLV